MSFNDWGNPAIRSGSTLVAGDSTATAFAEIAAADLLPFVPAGQSDKEFMVTWIIGGSTYAVWRCEQCLSTGLGSTAIRDTTFIQTPPGQSGQYQWKLRIQSGDLLRARINSTVALVSAKIIAEPLT
jgi:hypothetical protein